MNISLTKDELKLILDKRIKDKKDIKRYKFEERLKPYRFDINKINDEYLLLKERINNDTIRCHSLKKQWGNICKEVSKFCIHEENPKCEWNDDDIYCYTCRFCNKIICNDEDIDY
jgi:hypothetical protein